MAPLSRSPLARDALLGALLAAVSTIELVALDPELVEGSVVGHHVLNLLVLPSVALRRRSPLGSVLVASAGFAVQPLMGEAPVATPYLVLLFLLGSLGWYAATSVGAAGVAVVLASGLVYDVTTDDFRWADLVVNTAIIVAAWAALHLIRRATDHRIRAEVSAELGADRAAREAVEAERARIAQDLHDSMAHALTLMTLQAGTIRERTCEPALVDALCSIETSGREALADMHRFLGLLGPREDEAPGIGDLADLVDGVRRGGLDVALEVDLDQVPSSVGTTVYRVVQEGLTNVVRHSDARSASVRVRRQDTSLVTEVVDDGRPAPARTASGGHGLEGLRRRVGLFDGELSAGPTGKGWMLRARIPLAPGG